MESEDEFELLAGLGKNFKGFLYYFSLIFGRFPEEAEENKKKSLKTTNRTYT
jgi:hypothetical protein